MIYKAAVNIHVQVFCEQILTVLLGKCSGIELLDYMVDVIMTLLEAQYKKIRALGGPSLSPACSLSESGSPQGMSY